jgi:hypothetical protein
LLLSDLSPQGQRRLLEKSEDLRADVIISGVPSEGEPLINDLLSSVLPKLIIISDSANPWTSRARKSLRERLSKYTTLYCSDEGAVTLELNPKSSRLITMEGREIFLNKIKAPQE